MIELEPAIQALMKNEVEFVVVGGVAITAYGSAYITQDLDFCYLRSPSNLKKIADALAPFNPRLRGFPKESPFVWDERTLLNGTTFTLDTDLGDIDLLGEVSGVGDFADLKKSSKKLKLCGILVDVISIGRFD
mgnify:CR=1 FL=1